MTLSTRSLARAASSISCASARLLHMGFCRLTCHPLPSSSTTRSTCNGIGSRASPASTSTPLAASSAAEAHVRASAQSPRRSEEMVLLIAYRMPMAGHSRDVGPRLVSQTEQASIELDQRVERGAVAVDRYMVQPRHLHDALFCGPRTAGGGSSCSMNSRRM